MYILTRSSFLGQQRDGAVTWSGDTAGTWEALKEQITNAIHFTFSGIPYWSHDIGGWSYPEHYYPHFNEDKSFCELYTRWFAFGVFTPIFRSHGVKAPREMWQFGEENTVFYDALVQLTKLRYLLLSYIYSLSYEVSKYGFSMMRGLMMDFPEDENCWENKTQYMFGKQLLVMPVTDHMCHINPMYRKLTAEEYTLVTDNFYIDVNGENYRTADFQAQILAPDAAKSQKPKFKQECIITPKETGHYYILIEKAAYAVLYLDGMLAVNSEPNPYRFSDHYIEIELEANKQYKGELYYTPMDAEVEPVIKWKTPSEYSQQMTYKEPGESEIYLPATTNWYDFYTKTYYSGGQTVEKVIPLSEIGLFVKSGSVLPICEPMEYATQKLQPHICIEVYTGEDGTFTLYEDENDNYNYEEGAFALIEFQYREQDKTLTIGNRLGEFEGMKSERIFDVNFYLPEGNVLKKQVEYKGNTCVISIE